MEESFSESKEYSEEESETIVGHEFVNDELLLKFKSGS